MVFHRAAFWDLCSSTFYVNDMVNTNNNAMFIIHTDDRTIFFSGNSITYLISNCNDTSIKLQQWSLFNYMKIVENKTKVRAKNKPILPHADIIFNSFPDDIADHCKCLGVVFSAHMP